MRLPKIAIDNYAFVLVLVFLALCMGTLSFLNMPRSEDPALNFPLYTIVAVYPGADPKDIEELVVDPIEEKLNELDDLTEIRTSIKDGVAVIRIEGEFGVNTDDQFDEVRASVNTVRDQLPKELNRLEINQISPLDVKILQMAIVSEGAPYREMIKWAERLEDQLEGVKGVRNAEKEGYPEEEIRIALDLEKIARLGIPLNQVTGIIQGNNANIPGGDLDAGGQKFTLKTSGSYQSVEDLNNTVIAARNGNIVYLRDVATVYFGYEDPRYLARVNGKRAIFVSLTQKSGENILQITDDLDTEIARFQQELPQGMELVYAFKQGPAVASRINDFFMNLLQGIVLVGVVILLFLGIRNALIVMTVIPTSILIAIYLLDVSGFGLQQISIAGLVLALGMLVDNGIVVMENIHRFLKEGHSPVDAAIKGTAEVGWAIVSSTVTTILSFFPITQLGGGTGEFIQSLPLIVIYSLVASLILALLLTPLMASKLMRPVVNGQLTRAEKIIQNFVENRYRKLLQFSLAKPWVIIGIAVGSLVGSIALFPIVGVSFFPTAEKPMLIVNIDLPEGSNLAKTNQVAQYVESVLDTSDFVTGHVMNVGHGNPQIYYNLIPKNFAANHAQALVHLEAWDKEKFYKLVTRLRETFDQYPGAKIRVLELKNGPPYDAPVAIKIIGENLDSLKLYAADLEKVIAAQEGTLNVDNPLALSKTNIRTNINRDKAGMLGVQLADIDIAVRTAFTGNELGTLNLPDGKKYPLVARMAQGENIQASDFQRLSVASVTGAQVPLGQVAHLEFEPGASEIDHYGLERTVTVTADVKDDYNVTNITQNIIEELKTLPLPSGYEYYISGEYETQQESFGDLGKMLVVALLGIFAVLVLQFKSFSQPFVVFSAIPLAFSGSIVALFLSGYSFSFLAFVGFTSLAGIVVNTSIILVDYANQLIERGMPVKQALLQASETRFTPIMLTTLTTILGLVPLTLSNSSLWSPLGWTMIGGMVSSTILTLLIVPILYHWLTKKTT
ncbi:MAG: efflux RND transporter permease subunit [Bacteroidia bacterium]|nr:efflux RND transporter permease subunit [Bacteroidia bacterium]